MRKKKNKLQAELREVSDFKQKKKFHFNLFKVFFFISIEKPSRKKSLAKCCMKLILNSSK